MEARHGRARRESAKTAAFVATAALTFGACNKPAGTVAPAPPAVAVPTAATAAPPTAPSPSSPATAGDAQVRSFFALIYADEASASPNLKPRDEYDPTLAGAMAEENRLASAAADVGLDYDPICQCQDPTDMRWNISDLALTGPTAARASVLLTWPGPPQQPPQKVTFLLVETPAGWRTSTTSPPPTPQASCSS